MLDPETYLANGGDPSHYFNSTQCARCNMSEPLSPVCDPVCVIWLDMVWGIVHVLMGVIGLLVNTLALYVFAQFGWGKPYYVVIMFETMTDLVVSAVALFSGVFLLSGRDSSFDTVSCRIAGMLWNWNMVATPLLLSIAGALRIKAVYWPHNNTLTSVHIIIMCVMTYLYGVVFATFPYMVKGYGYRFDNEWSICDFIYNAGADKDFAVIYTILMGPIPMLISLIIIIVTNLVIGIYLYQRYKASWRVKVIQVIPGKKRGKRLMSTEVLDSPVHSKQVVISIFLMTVWYMLCYSLIIFNNFKNLVGNLTGHEISVGPKDRVGETYFFATYNFCAYLNSFVNPFIQLNTGNMFRAELCKLCQRFSRFCQTRNSGNGSTVEISL